GFALPGSRFAAPPSPRGRGMFASTSMLCLRHPLLHLARQVRNNADHAFDEHELATMMHLVFFDRCDHIEAVSRRGCAARRHGYHLAEEFFGNAGNETGPLFTFLPQ